MWSTILKRLYSKGQINNVVIGKCVNVNMITASEYETITGEPYTV